MKQFIRRVASAIAPEWEKRISDARWLRQHVDELRLRLYYAKALEDRVDIARNAPRVRSNQKRAEILALLQEVSLLQPRTVCEIGADKGGTLALFASAAAADAQILSIDVHYPMAAAKSYPFLAGSRQIIHCLESDSHLPSTLQYVKGWLGGRKLDFLFIDGDHSYSGVKADYEMYGPLVRKGGIIAFHDIVPDFMTRHGERTACDVGEVPRYWKELRDSIASWSEFIEHSEQDGYGIGLARVS